MAPNKLIPELVVLLDFLLIFFPYLINKTVRIMIKKARMLIAQSNFLDASVLPLHLL